MINNLNPLSMAEVLKYVGESKDSETDLKKFIKKFGNLKPGEAKEMREKLENLNLMKMKPDYIVKIIDLLPEDLESLNKIFSDVSLSEDEAQKILETIKEFR